MANYRPSRPASYQYFNILMRHLGGDLRKIFSGRLVYPRQLEVHLPGDHQRHCNFDCHFCQGRLLKRTLVPYERTALELINKLEGKIPYHIYGGAYTEPLLNPYLMSFLNLTKKHGSYFGIHTNGSYLKRLEKKQGWLTELCRLATSAKDYLSISLDAGTPQSHKISKDLKKDWFSEIIEGIRLAVKIRGRSKAPAIRVCYLLNDINSSKEEIKTIVWLAKQVKVDSLRFSIPYEVYGKSFAKVRDYKKKVEVKQNQVFKKMLAPWLSQSLKAKPYIFYLSPEHQDVEKMNFKQCVYGYYQITLGADGYVYRCSSTASPSFRNNRLGKITGDLPQFKKMIKSNFDPNFEPSTCFKTGGRCNRMALEINDTWRKLND
jgi:MoaA/NifB/PqqE/SkfB family radical SAM enzyme